MPLMRYNNYARKCARAAEYLVHYVRLSLESVQQSGSGLQGVHCLPYITRRFLPLQWGAGSMALMLWLDW
jgi:hypothetical protein